MINTSNSGMCSDCCALIKIEDHTEILWGPHVNLFSHDQDIDRISVNRIRYKIHAKDKKIDEKRAR